jgi:hypothetical protein
MRWLRDGCTASDSDWKGWAVLRRARVSTKVELTVDDEAAIEKEPRD